MSSLSYNHLILQLQSTNTVGKVLTNPTVSDFDIKKAITLGPPIVRLKLLKYCLETPRCYSYVSAFFEKEASNSNFGQTSVNWIDGFPKHSTIVMSHVLNHLQPVHYKDFIVGCVQRVDENADQNNVYNCAVLQDIYRLKNWPTNIVGVVLDQIHNCSVGWKNVIALKLAYNAHTQTEQERLLEFVQKLPSFCLSEPYGVEMLYHLVNPVHQPLLEIFLKKISLDDFTYLVKSIDCYWEAQRYELFAQTLPNNLECKRVFFEEMTLLHDQRYIDDHLYAKMERMWLEANLTTTSDRPTKRKM